MLAKSVTSIKEISQALQLDYRTVQNDIKWIREQANPWLYGLAGGGYAHDSRMALEKLMSIERELEDMRQDARENNAGIRERIMLLVKLADVTIQRLSIEGNGPTLLGLRKILRG